MGPYYRKHMIRMICMKSVETTWELVGVWIMYAYVMA